MNNLSEYISLHSTAEPLYLKQIYHDTHLHVVNPHMLTGHIQGRILALLAKMIQPQHILEIGTYTGYSALCLAEGLAQGGRLLTIEINDELEDTIQHNLSLSPLGNRIDVAFGDAKEVLKDCNEMYDLVFIDADKREYCAYLDLIYTRTRVNGWILADNTLWDGHVIDSAYDHDAQTKGLKAFNDRVAQDPRLEKVILPIRDGLTLIYKHSE